MSLRSRGLSFAKAVSAESARRTAVSRNVRCHYAGLHQLSTRPTLPAPATTCQWSDNYSHFISLRTFSAKPEEADAPPTEEQAPPTEGTDANATTAESQEETPETKIANLEKQLKDLKDNLLRSLAEQENTRRIAKRDVDSARTFAISSFAKSLLDTSDNLSRALAAVPEELRHDHENHPVLANLYEGISMTDEGLTKAFGKNGLRKFGEVGEKFDPNRHEALFEYPDEKGVPGSIGQVMKVGFELNERVIRPAEVGVVKAP